MATNADHHERAFFEQQVTDLLDSLFGAALRLTKNRSDAEDLVAECVAKAWANFSTLHDRACFRAWIFRILTNTFLSECRRLRMTSLEALTEHDDGEAHEAFSLFEQLHQPFLLWWGNPEGEFLNQVLRDDLVKAMETLPEVYRVPVILCDLEGFSYPEIAEMLEVPVGTVRSRLFRGRSLLQKTLWKYAPEIRNRRTATATAHPSSATAGERHE